MEKNSSRTDKSQQKWRNNILEEGVYNTSKYTGQRYTSKHVRRARDPICMVTVNEKPDEKNKTQNESDKQKRDNVRDILQVCGRCRWVLQNGNIKYSDYDYFNWHALIQNLNFTVMMNAVLMNLTPTTYIHTQKRIQTTTLSIDVILDRDI